MSRTSAQRAAVVFFAVLVAFRSGTAGPVWTTNLLVNPGFESDVPTTGSWPLDVGYWGGITPRSCRPLMG